MGRVHKWYRPVHRKQKTSVCYTTLLQVFCKRSQVTRNSILILHKHTSLYGNAFQNRQSLCLSRTNLFFSSYSIFNEHDEFQNSTTPLLFVHSQSLYGDYPGEFGNRKIIGRQCLCSININDYHQYFVYKHINHLDQINYSKYHYDTKLERTGRCLKKVNEAIIKVHIIPIHNKSIRSVLSKDTARYFVSL